MVPACFLILACFLVALSGHTVRNQTGRPRTSIYLDRLVAWSGLVISEPDQVTKISGEYGIWVSLSGLAKTQSKTRKKCPHRIDPKGLPTPRGIQTSILKTRSLKTRLPASAPQASRSTDFTGPRLRVDRRIIETGLSDTSDTVTRFFLSASSTSTAIAALLIFC